MMPLKQRLLLGASTILLALILFVVFAENGMLPDFVIRPYHRGCWSLLIYFNNLWVDFLDRSFIGRLGILIALVAVVFIPLYVTANFNRWDRALGYRWDCFKIRRARQKYLKGGIVLGLAPDSGKPVFISNKLRTEHTLVLGSTGTGKTTSVLEPSMVTDIQSGRPLIFITAKEEPDFLRRFCGHVHQSGRSDDLRIVTLSDSLPSHSYNPLIYGDATALRDLCMESFTWDNPYYRDQAKSALLYVLTALRLTGKTFTLRDLYYVFTQKECLDLLSAMLADPEVKHHLEGYSNDWTTFRDNMRGLAANLEDYTTPKLRDRLCNPSSDINFVEDCKNDRILVFVLNSLQYGETARRLGRMVIQNIRYLAGLMVGDRQYERFLPLYIDEFHHFVYPEFFSMIAQCRSSNIGVTLSTQSFADLKGPNWDITTQVIQNTNTKVILRQNDADSADLVARLAGTRTVTFLTEQVEQRIIYGQTKTGLGTTKTEEEFIIHPNRIRTLPRGQAACLVKGHALLVELYPPDPAIENDFDLAKISNKATDSSRAEAVDIYGRWMAKKKEEKKQGIRRPQVKNKNTSLPQQEDQK